MHAKRRGRLLALASTSAIALVLAFGSAAPGAASDPPADEVAGALISSASAHELTLVTGDAVTVEQSPDGRRTVSIAPASRDGYEPSFDTVDDGEHVYVIPSDAAPLVPGVLDRELFNVTKLAEYGYTNGTRVIVMHDGSGQRQVGTGAGLQATATLPSINATAATVTDGGRWWRDVQAAVTGSTDLRALAESEPLAGVEKVWLDERVEAALDESVPQIGAPDAWDAGYDGTGVTVAVLDTGIDTEHPDLTDAVVAEENFSSSDTVSDRYGHGTHVAGIITGSATASDGTYVGVAPGVELLNGKVLDDAGNGTIAGVIAGMEWAADQSADVVNMSLGTRGQPSDGTDPLSQAVNEISEQHDVLFVIAAGNDGPRDETINAPGAADAALTVGSVDKAEELAETSSRGPRLGDSAIKPEVTAPGVDIVAARAEGSTLGTPVGEHYMRLSGTSMATPHVAGAAAIVRQADPDLSVDDLKAALATTAIPHDDLDVYQQGGGRIDVPAALDAPVLATPATLDLGVFPDSPDAEPVSAEVTYTNRSDDPLTLDLGLEVESRDGDVPSDDMLFVEPTTLALAPGDSARATVTVDFSMGDVGLYGGYLVAEAAGEVATRTPVGFGQPEQHTLTIEGINRDGQPVANGFGNVSIIDVHDSANFRVTLIPFVDGSLTFRLPPGTYSVMGILRTGEQFVTQDVTLMGDPELTLTEDTTLVLDARDATRITVDTPAHVSAPRGSAVIGYVRWSENEDAPGVAPLSFSEGHVELYAQETDPVSIGEFEPQIRRRLGQPELALDVAEPLDVALDPVPMANSPALDGEHVLPLVDAGLGRPEDYAGVGAEGAVVLTRRSGIFPATLEANAAAAGAAALLVANDEPGRFLGAVSTIASVPTMSLPKEEGDLLLDRLDEGAVELRLQGHPTTPFLYDLVLPEEGSIPDDLGYVVHPDELASVHNAFHSDVAGHELGESRAPWRFDIAAVVAVQPLAEPHARTDYLMPGTTRYQQAVYAVFPFTARMVEPITVYERGEQREQTWFKSPRHPGVNEGSEFTIGQPASRTGDILRLLLPEWVDSQRGHWSFVQAGMDTSAVRLYRNSELVATASRPRGSFALSPDPAEYRLEVDVARDAEWWTTSTETNTAWTIQSARPEGGGTEIVPLMLVDYEVELDLFNTVPHPRDRNGPATVDLQVRHQPGADGPAIAGARAWVSYDDGDTWRPRPVRDLGDGHYQAILDSRDPDDTNGYAALRVEAWDTDDNRIEQDIIRAWKLAPR